MVPADSSDNGEELSMSAILVEYDEAVLQELRARAVEGSQAMPFGGLEIGAVLFGARAASHLQIKSTRLITCEHAKGPGFVLSQRDQEGLAEILHGAVRDPALSGLTVLGWIRSTRRQTLHLTPEDVAIHDAFFHEPWHVALVMKPRVFGPSRVGVFVRDLRGMLAAETPAQEFEVGAPASVLSPRTERRAFGEGRERRAEVRASSIGAPPLPVGVEPSAPEPVPVPQFLLQPSSRREFPRWALVVLLVVALGAAAAGGYSLYVRGQQPEVAPVPLRIVEESGQLQISWSPHAPAVQQATGGQLRIVDGGAKRDIPLDRAALFGGSATYAGPGANVTASLRIDTPSGPVEQSTTFLGPVGVRPASAREFEELLRERDALKEEVRKLTERALFAERQLGLQREALRLRLGSPPPAMRTPAHQPPTLVGPRP